MVAWPVPNFTIFFLNLSNLMEKYQRRILFTAEGYSWPFWPQVTESNGKMAKNRRRQYRMVMSSPLVYGAQRHR
jgi:hypothetical protein